MSTHALVAAALSKITNTQIITYDDYLLQKDKNPDYDYQMFDYGTLHETYLVKGPVSSDNIDVEEEILSSNNNVSSHNIRETENPIRNIENLYVKKFLGGTLTINDLNENSTISQLKDKIYETEGIPPDEQCLIIRNVFIKNLSGETITIRNINANTSISQLKNKIYEIERIPLDQQCLTFDHKTLQDHQTLGYYEITNDTTIYLTIRLLGGSNTIRVLDLDFLDPHYDYDFTNMKSSGNTYMRGNYKYNRPYGWKRIALKVLDKFPD